MASDDRTDRYRPVFEPEDIFDRFVKNANASTEEALPREDEPTGPITTAKAGQAHQATVRKRAGFREPPTKKQRGLPGAPPAWDHHITVMEAPEEGDPEGTRPDAVAPTAPVAIAAPPSEEDDFDEDCRTVPRTSPLAKGGPLTTDSGQRILLLTRVKRPGEKSQPPPPPVEAWFGPEDELDAGLASALEPLTPDPFTQAFALTPMSEEPSTVPAPPSAAAPTDASQTQRLDALRVVPDVQAAASRADTTYVGEGVEDGQMPTRQLDQLLSDMAVLLRYGHAGQVRERLDDLLRTYPEDLLLMRRIAEFHVEHEQTAAALETLFALAGGLFERRNVDGMRHTLEQILVLDPGNARAYRLLGLLEHRA